MPTLYLIGGPNGAGKSTLSFYLPRLRDIERIDPDEYISEQIRQGVSDLQSLQYSLQLKLDDLFENKVSFIYESNLHNEESYLIVRQAKKFRYKVELTFISVDNTTLLYDRVEERAALGKHNVPIATIQNRYEEGLRILPSHFNDFDKISLIDSSNRILSEPILISKYEQFQMPTSQIPNWCSIALLEYQRNYYRGFRRGR